MQKIPVTEVKEGQILAAPVYNRFNLKIFNVGVVLDKAKIGLLHKWGIKEVEVEEPEEIETKIKPEESSAQPAQRLHRQPGTLTLERDVINQTITELQDLHIKGSVRNSKIACGGDVVVAGDLEGSIITSYEGNVEIRGAVMNSVLTANQSVIMNTGVNIKVHCGESFLLNEYAENVRISNGTTVLCADKGIYTGEISNVKHILANNLGAKYGKLQIKFTTMEFEEYSRLIYRHHLYLKNLRQKYEDKMKMLQSSINIVKMLGEKIKQLEVERQKVLLERTKEYLFTNNIIKIIEEALHSIDKQLETQERIYVKVLKNMYGNVYLAIDNRQLEVTDLYNDVEVYFKGLIRIV